MQFKTDNTDNNDDNRHLSHQIPTKTTIIDSSFTKNRRYRQNSTKNDVFRLDFVACSQPVFAENSRRPLLIGNDL